MADYYQNSHDDEQNTAAIVWQDAVTLTLDGEDVDWIVGFSVETHTSSGSLCYCQGLIDATEYGSGHTRSNSYGPFLFMVKVNLASGIRTLKVQWHTSDPTKAAYVRRARIIAIRASMLPSSDSIYESAEINTVETDYQTATTLTAVTQTALHLAVASCRLYGSAPSSGAQCRLYQDDATTLGEVNLTHVTTLIHQVFTIIKRLDLTAGSHSFKLQYKTAADTAYIAYRSLILIRLTDLAVTYVENENENDGDGGSAASGELSSAASYLILESGEINSGTRTLTVGGTVEALCAGLDATHYYPCCSLKVETYAASTSMATTYSSWIRRSRIFALDLALKTTPSFHATGHCMELPRMTEPEFIAETTDRLINKFTVLEINQSIAGELSDFNIIISNAEWRMRTAIPRYSVINLYGYCAGYLTLLLFGRIEDIQVDRETGKFMQLSGRHYFSQLALAGRDTDYNYLNREVGDAVRSSTDGVVGYLIPEIGVSYVSSTSTVLQDFTHWTGQKSIDVLTSLVARASTGALSYYWWLDNGDSELGDNVPQLHLDTLHKNPCPVEFHTDRCLRYIDSETCREIVNKMIVDHSTGTVTSEDTASQSKPWGTSPYYRYRSDLTEVAAQSFADLIIANKADPSAYAIVIDRIDFRVKPGQQTILHDGLIEREATVTKITWRWEEWEDEGFNRAYAVYTLGNLSEYPKNHYTLTRSTGGIILDDNFNDELKAAEWIFEGDTANETVTEQNDRLEFSHDQDNYCHVQRLEGNIDNPVLICKVRVPSFDLTEQDWAASLAFWFNQYDWVAVRIENATPTFRASYNKNTVVTNVDDGVPAEDTWYWLKIKITTPTVYFYYSSDGRAWTEITNTARVGTWTIDANSLVILGHGYEVSGGSYPNPDWDNSG